MNKLNLIFKTKKFIIILFCEKCKQIKLYLHKEKSLTIDLMVQVVIHILNNIMVDCLVKIDYILFINLRLLHNETLNLEKLNITDILLVTDLELLISFLIISAMVLEEIIMLRIMKEEILIILDGEIRRIISLSQPFALSGLSQMYQM